MPRSEATTRTANAARQRPQAPRSRVGTGNGAAQPQEAVSRQPGASAEVGRMVRVEHDGQSWWGRVERMRPGLRGRPMIEVANVYRGVGSEQRGALFLVPLSAVTAVREAWDTPEANRVRAIGREEE